jgi:hypothetical protein
VFDGGVAREAEMDPRVRDKVCLKLGQVHVQRTIKAERSSEGGNDLRDQAIEIGKLLQDNGVTHFEEPCPYWEPEQTKKVTDTHNLVLHH